jgi:hypothetical protein
MYLQKGAVALVSLHVEARNVLVRRPQAVPTKPSPTCCVQQSMMQSTSQPHCTCSDVLVGSRRPFTDRLIRQHRRQGLRAHRRSRCNAAWHSDIHRHEAAAEDPLSSEGAHAPSYQRPQQLVEVSAAPSPAQQQIPAFLGTPKGAAAALALAGVTGLGLRALFSKGSRWGRQTALR